jgi:hypothetical protein
MHKEGNSVREMRAIGNSRREAGTARKKKLRRVPIESVDFLDAGVASQQGSAVRSNAAPVSEGSSGRLKPFQTEYSLEFVIGDLHPEVAFLVIEIPVKIQIARVSGPRRISYENPGELSPFLSGEIKKHELERISVMAAM